MEISAMLSRPPGSSWQGPERYLIIFIKWISNNYYKNETDISKVQYEVNYFIKKLICIDYFRIDHA